MRRYLKRKLAENLRHPNGFFGRLIGGMMNHFNNGIIELSIASIPEIDNEGIAEVGIGSGKAIQLCNRRFPNAMIFGFDISTTMLSAAKRRNKKLIRDKKLILSQASISKIPLENESIAVLYTINTLYFWNDPDEVFKEVHRILKENGHFIISFNPKEEMNPSMYPSDLFTFYTDDQVKKLALRNHFKVISSQPYNDRYEKYVCLVLKKAEH